DDDRRRRERKHRESSRAKDGKDGKGTRDPRTGRMRKPGGFDTIDNLDVTGIYGSGLFHHDGPFDACNPHRNRRRDHKAPMEAFPVNSANNVLGPSGPVNKTFNMDQFHGTVPEGFTDYNNTQRPHKAQRGGVFNPVERAEQVHGEETFGLGTSTFLEGAPASRAAIQRRESEAEEKARLAALDPAGGLGRKKSLAQRIRGISAPRRSVYDANGVKISSPEARFSAAVTSPMGQTPGSGPERSKTTGGMKTSEKNPFFNEYDDAYERKGAAIALARGSGEEPRRSSVPAVPAVPKLIPVQDEISVVKPGGEKVASPTKVTANPLERRTTTDGVGAEPEKEKESVEAVQKAREGLMSRMKSLKGVRRKP
ncbi:Pal1-domain-containing protein, partial [Eremomyces bilateralis CBS 781.70]